MILTDKHTMAAASRIRSTMMKIDFDIIKLQELNDLTERLLTEELNRVTEKIDKKLSTLSGEDREYSAGWYADDIFQLSEEFPQLLRRALFLTTMSMIEYNLVLLCDTVCKTCNLSSVYIKPRQDVIRRSLKYLETSAGFQFNRLSENELIYKYQKIRNAMIHNDGKPKKEHLQEMKSFCKKDPRLDMDRHGYIVIKEGFPSMVLHKSRLFFSNLERQTGKAYSKYRDITQ